MPWRRSCALWCARPPDDRGRRYSQPVGASCCRRDRRCVRTSWTPRPTAATRTARRERGTHREPRTSRPPGRRRCHRSRRRTESRRSRATTPDRCRGIQVLRDGDADAAEGGPHRRVQQGGDDQDHLVGGVREPDVRRDAEQHVDDRQPVGAEPVGEHAHDRDEDQHRRSTGPRSPRRAASPAYRAAAPCRSAGTRTGSCRRPWPARSGRGRSPAAPDSASPAPPHRPHPSASDRGPVQHARPAARSSAPPAAGCRPRPRSASPGDRPPRRARCPRSDRS